MTLQERGRGVRCFVAPPLFLRVAHRLPEIASIANGRDGFGPRRYWAYCATPLPKDQFSFFTSTRLMSTSSMRTPKSLCRFSATAL
jgi:hypothetical protein